MHSCRRPMSVRVASAGLAVVFTHASIYPGFALPRGERVTKGDAGFERSGDTLIINQASGKAVIEYDGFDIGAAETVRFNQPGASASALNRVTGGAASTIAGALQANGNVFIVNPAGVIFSAGARVDVHGLVASAMNITDDNFMAGKLEFSGGGGKVSNQGTINAAYAYLIGGSVENTGTINAPDVALQAGSGTIRLGEAEGGEINLVVSEEAPVEPADPQPTVTVLVNDASGGATVNSLAKGDLINQGVVNASGLTGGRVQAQGNRVANLGSIVADGSAGKGGEIAVRAADQIVLGPGSVTSANGGGAGDGGTITFIAQNQFVSAPDSVITAKGGAQAGNGGFVETSGLKGFQLGSSPVVGGGAGGRGGEWRIDPYDIDIVSSVSFSQNMLTFFGSPWQPTAQNAQVAIAQIRNFFTTGGGDTLRINTADDFDSVQLGGFVRDPYQQGNITLVDNFDLNGIDANRTAPTPYTLILQAHNNIVLNGIIGDSDPQTPDQINLVLEADWQQLPSGDPNQTIRPVPNTQMLPNPVIDGPDGDGLGNVSFNANLSTYGGKLTASGQNITQATGTTISLGSGTLTLIGDVDNNGTGDVTLDGVINTTGADVFGQNVTLNGSLTSANASAAIKGDNDVTINGSLVLTGFNFPARIAAVNADYDNNGTGIATVSGTGAITSDGDIDVRGNTVQIDGDLIIPLNGNAIYLNARDGVQIGSTAQVSGDWNIAIDGDTDDDLIGDVIANVLLSTRDFARISASGYNVRLLGGASVGLYFGDSLVINADNDAEVAGFDLINGGAYLNADADASGAGNLSITANGSTGGGNIYGYGHELTTSPGVILDTDGGDIQLYATLDLHLGLGGSLDTTEELPVLAGLPGKGPLSTGSIYISTRGETDCLGEVLLGSDLITGGGEVSISGLDITGPGDIDTTGYPGNANGTISLTACDHIDVTGNYRSDGRDILLTADADADLIGDLTSTGTMTTQGGRFSASGVNAAQSGQVTTSGGNAAVTGRINASLGATNTGGITGGGSVNVTADDDANLSGDAALTGNISTFGGNVVVQGHTARTSANVVVDTDSGYIDVLANAGVTLGTGGVLDTRPGTRVIQPNLPGAPIRTLGEILVNGDVDLNCVGDVVIGSNLITGGQAIEVLGANVTGGGSIYSNGGTVDISACVNVNLSGAEFQTAGGSFTLTADSDANNTGDLTLAGATTTASGIFLGTGVNATLTGTVVTEGGLATLAGKNNATANVIDTRVGTLPFITGGAEVRVTADSDDSGAGVATLNGGLYSGGSSVTVIGESITGNANYLIDTDGGNALLQARSGVILNGTSSINTVNQLTVSFGLPPRGGSITIQGDQDANCIGNVLLNSGLTSGGGAIDVRGANITGGGGGDSSLTGLTGGNITFTACTDINITGSMVLGGGNLRLAADAESTPNRIGNVRTTGTFLTGGGTLLATGENVRVLGSTTTAGGTYTLLAANEAQSGRITTSGGSAGGAVVIEGDRLNASPGAVLVGGDIRTGGANVTVSGETVATSASVLVDTDGGYVLLTARSGVTLGAGGTVDTTPAAPVLAGGPSLAAGEIQVIGDDDVNCVGAVSLGSNLITAGAPVLVSGGSISGNGGIFTSGGHITLSACDDIFAGGTYLSGGGNVSIQADTDANGVGDLTRTSLTTTAGGSYSTYGHNNSQGSSTTTSGGNAVLLAANDLTVSGSINTAGTSFDGYISLVADDDSRFASNGTGKLTLASSSTLSSDNNWTYLNGAGIELAGSISNNQGGVNAYSSRNIVQSGGIETYGGWVGLAAEDDILLTSTAHIDTTGGFYDGTVELASYKSAISLNQGVTIDVDYYSDICLEAALFISIGGGLYSELGNIEAFAGGNLLIESVGEIIASDEGFVLDGLPTAATSGDVILVAGHRAELVDPVNYIEELVPTGAGDLVFLGGLVESEGGDVLGLGHEIGLDYGTVRAAGTAGFRAVTNVRVGNTIEADEVLVEAGGSMSVDGTVNAGTQALFEANGGAIGGTGTVTAPSIGFKAAGDVGDGSGLNVNAASLLLVEQSVAGARNLNILGVAPSLGTLAGYQELVSNCLYYGKGERMIVIGPDIVINGNLIVTTEDPEPEPKPEGEPERPRPVVVSIPPSLPPVDVHALIARFLVDIPNFKERVKIFEEFFFLHLTMQISEFAMDLDLNFIDYLLFGEARIQTNAQLPAEAKDTIYIGGIRPYRSTSGKAPGYQGTIQ